MERVKPERVGTGTEMYEMNSLDTDLVLFVKLVSGGKEACDVFRHLHILLKEDKIMIKAVSQ